ncbi:hypothetical protein [Deinococcus arenicola]|uniref:Uncharacterized protein n=1 Tax=Deinococcus arenicola TaxID=2994950 RepID=A0ABU4DRA3_9DEIO|nr:hypothetical protein [Deinococcus sp. ZS9-10]MDV6374390.1 hypothetical protein [Deinococcus sp. ZS9-10]
MFKRHALTLSLCLLIPQGYLNLDSALDTPTETMGDHDGRVLVLVAQQ